MPIDAAAYPHILDAIISHAVPSALIALRAGSTSLRDRVDAIFFEHIGVHYQDSAAHLRAVDGSRLPSLPIPNPASWSPETKAALARFAQQATHVRAVDLYAPIPAVLSLLHPEVVRRRGPRAHLIGHQLKAVTYVDSMRGEKSARAIHDAFNTGGLPRDQERSVITLQWVWGDRLMFPIPKARDVVFVLEPTIHRRNRYPDIGSVENLAIGPELVTFVQWVGAEQMPTSRRDRWIGPSPTLWQMFRRHLEDKMGQTSVEGARAAEVRFISHEEWAAEAGKYVIA
ncbi:hypothetical protein CspHIS471_0311090 [Cutaneotrichosporon sp. HIS471]|nr:hypothetical protein CspHIS471_0311090 [Cutaneotrichosporon sp. HIS471]